MFQFLILLLMANSPLAFAQMSLPSIFAHVKSVNPAVISERVQAHGRLTFQQDFLERKLGTDTSNPDEKYDIHLESVGGFMGSSKNSGLNYEANADYAQGEQKALIRSGETFNVNYNVTAKALHGRLALGFRKFGVDVHSTRSETEYQQTVEDNGNTYEAGAGESNEVFGVKFGGLKKFDDVYVGWTAGYDSIDIKAVEGGGMSAVQFPDHATIFGVGVGAGGRKGVIEAAVESDPLTDRPPELKGVPMKVSLLLEKKIWILVLGLKSMLFFNYYEDLEKPIQNQLVYRLYGGQARTEHVFNFALAADRGLSLLGSAYYSRTQRDERFGGTQGGEYKSLTTEYGYSVGVGYTY